MVKQKLSLVATGMILGGLPNNLNALAFANDARKEVTDAPPVTPVEVGIDVESDEPTQRTESVFRRTPEGLLAVDEHVIQGMFRESVKFQESATKFRGLWMRLHTDPYLLPFKYDPKNVTKEVRAFSVMGPQGRRSVVNIHEAIIKPRLDFTLEMHTGKEYDIEDVIQHFQYAGRYIGLGGGRGKSGLEYHYGFFNVEVNGGTF